MEPSTSSSAAGDEARLVFYRRVVCGVLLLRGNRQTAGRRRSLVAARARESRHHDASHSASARHRNLHREWCPMGAARMAIWVVCVSRNDPRRERPRRDPRCRLLHHGARADGAPSVAARRGAVNSRRNHRVHRLSVFRVVRRARRSSRGRCSRLFCCCSSAKVRLRGSRFH